MKREERFALFSFLCENLIEIGRKIYLHFRRLSTVCGQGIFNICFVLIFFILFRTSTSTYI